MNRQIANKYSIFSIPLLLILLSYALNLHALAADSFWGDEILTASFAARSPAEVVRWTANDIHPPLYYLLVGAFTRIAFITEQPSPASDWLWRFPSAVAVTLSVAVTYSLARRVLGKNTANAAAFLLCLAPIAIKYGQETRMHALFMFLSIFSTLLFFRALSRPVWWLAFALVTAANIYTIYFGFLILTAQAGLLFCLLINSRWKPAVRLQLGGFSLAVLLAFLLYTPWWPVLFNILRKRATVGAIEGGVGSSLTFIYGVVRALGPDIGLAAWGFMLLFIVGLFFLSRHNWPVAIFAVLWLGLPIILPIFMGDPRALQFRYAFILPIYLTVIAYGLVSLSRYLSVNLTPYLIWVLATVSFIATLGIYNQTKPDWRAAATYLDEHTSSADIILIGPLWDEGRFIDYYYRGQAQFLTPAALVTNIEHRAESMRMSGGRVWAVNRFAPAESPVLQNIAFSGVVLSEPQLAVYEPDLLSGAAIDLAAQAANSAYSWATEAEAQGVLNPDPRTARASALRAWGDALAAAGRYDEALIPYQTAVDIFPGWVSGFIVLAQTEEQVGNLQAAAKAYQQAVVFNIKWHNPQADEAAALVEAGMWVEALEKYHQIIGE